MSKLTRTQLIKTEAGNNFAPPLKRVLVRFKDHYVSKCAKDLAEGDKVRWNREFIQKTLDEVDLVLSAQSGRYASSREMVMEQNSARVWIPKLRVHLLESMTNASRAQILLEGTDITPEEYRAVSNMAHERILEYSSMHSLDPVCWDTVLNWVSGKVIAPAEKRFFDALGSFNPVLSEIYLDFVGNGPWSEAYSIYTNLRKVAMSYISDLQLKEGNGSGKRRRKGEGLDFGPELSAVVEAFGEEMRSRFIDVEVLGNETLRLDKKKISKKRGMEPHLFRGIAKADGELGEIKIDRLENYALEEIFGSDFSSALDGPEKAIEHAKKFVIERGFSLEDLRDWICRDCSPKSVVNDFEEFASEHSWPSEKELAASMLKDMGIGGKLERVYPQNESDLVAVLEGGSEITLSGFRKAYLAEREKCFLRIADLCKLKADGISRLIELAEQAGSEEN
jgi:hypothetical protein